MNGELREVVAKAICNATSSGVMFPWETLNEREREAWSVMGDGALAAIALSNHAIVKLPESDGVDDDGQEYFGEDLDIRVDHTGRPGEHHRLYVNGRPVAPETARNDAAELLIAAATAEAAR